jgi:predicted amidophosphoribosyltransferase
MFQPNWLKRGNNHSYLLAKKLSQQANIPLLNKELLQIKATEPQKQLSFKARKRNVKGAFTFTGSCDVIAGKQVAVVDDILTSMATVNEISRVLKAAGAATVHAWVFARTEKQAVNRSTNR